MNYIIESNLNFYDLLNDALKEDTNNDNDNDNDNEESLCLISNTLIKKETCITLHCGHKFNYQPLFNEIESQKLLSSVM